MVRINENFLLLQKNYLFKEIEQRVSTFKKNNPQRQIINLGIGDVTNPIPSEAVKALHKATDDMGDKELFRGYGPVEGYQFLREAIIAADFRSREIYLSANEIFVSDGSKCDTGNFQELFSPDAKIAIQDPVYPVYVESNVMAGRSGAWKNERYENFHYLIANSKNAFIPDPPKYPVDMLYLCFPNNPTGAVATREQLQAYVDYALKNKALILFDAAYAAFIRDIDIPHSIFEIEGSKQCAVEFRSFSKTAGFTGLRAAYVVIPDECQAWDGRGQPHSVQALWKRRQNTRFNGLSYPVQRAAEAVLFPKGQTQVRELVDEYLKNAILLAATLDELGFPCAGGKNAPYIWVKTGLPSWDSFNILLEDAGIITTPGVGFGHSGEQYIRFSAFTDRETIFKAIRALREVAKRHKELTP